MANPLFEEYNQNRQNNSPMNFFQALQQLKATGGDPNQRIQELLNSGKITQEQYNNAVERAKQLQKFFGK